MVSKELLDVIAIWRQSLESIWDRQYLFRCLHFATISDLLFNKSPSLCSAIANFSVRHSKHFLLWGLYDLAFFRIRQDTSGVPPASLILQISFESSLSPSFRLFVKVWRCSFILSLPNRSVTALHFRDFRLVHYLWRQTMTVQRAKIRVAAVAQPLVYIGSFT